MQDGARNAFTGYLYQFLGTASLQAQAITASELDAELSADLVACVEKGQLIHELHGQDAVIKVQPGGNGEAVAIQFKYGRTPDRTTIERSELIDILHAFDRSRREAQSRGESLDRFVLVTNRTFDGNAQALYDKRGEAQVPAELFLPEKTPAGQDIARTKTVVKEYGSVPAAASAWHAVLKKLSVWQKLRYEAAVVQLQELATRHGLSAGEFDQACGRIIGSILKATDRGPFEITREWLTECLVEAPDALVLHLPSPEPTTRSAAARALERHLGDVVRADDSLIRRRLIDEVSTMIRQFPVVWLTGDGGCGKSVLGIQLLIQEASARLTLFLPGRNATHDLCFAQALNEIRSERHSHLLVKEPTQELLDRVRVANEGVPPPLILIDLDGLDEVHESERHRLRQLIDRFFSRGQAATPDAVLVLTCRAPERDRTRAVEGLVSTWFDTEWPDMIAAKVGAVHVGDFDQDELREAASKLPEDVCQRIDEMLPWNPVAELGSTGDGSTDSGGPTPSERGLVDSLRHPVMWGVFTALSANDRLPAISGNEAALSVMADKFLDRFCRKAITRRTTLRQDQIRAALTAIGKAPPHDTTVRTRQTHWMQPAFGPLNQDEAAFLYGEGLSYGLIREDFPGQWRWRHGFVCDRLRGGGQQ